MTPNCAFDVGWGRLIFGQTFESLGELVDVLREEAPGRRDIAIYVEEPHVLLSFAPQEVFLDPSHTYRLQMADYRPSERKPAGFVIRPLASQADADAINRIYASRGMVTVPPQFFQSARDPDPITYLVAEDELTGRVIGTVTGVDHRLAFNDRKLGTSLWCLAVDPQARQPGIGEALVRHLAEHVSALGASFLDLSVMHDNTQAIALYEKLGFERVTMFTVKRKNPINEKLFAGEGEVEGFNPYARIIIDEARRRGILVEPIDAKGGFFRLTFGARSVRCRESLSELTSSVAMSICDDKSSSRQVVADAGVRVPAQLTTAAPMDDIVAFLKQHQRLVVKPARGEQGQGISVGLTTLDELDAAIVEARKVSNDILIEECIDGDDLRLVVINFKVVAAAIRRPATVVGDGSSTIDELIQAQSRRRAAATGGESRIPRDGETERTVRAAGFDLNSVLPAGQELKVRRTANLHTGGTIHDVTDSVHPALIEAGVKVARAIDIPVVGVDLMVRAPTEPGYAFIEANERPGLANHEPQPTAERFIDLLFPLAIPAGVRQVLETSQARADL
ncbi:N-acetylglutaminylglutamine synthetase [Starkeya koreensis]|uniref:N-acetylglutaminylglutamine synthetase n=1 Tax=Ancylobacter koreensis TaxID=266121 RepID=A0ABT0DGP0_9HYPH|nr:N-acetylglutaminylglutamine synthetase [Ancylobacter koreensis]MCK0206455.1 N-acetylglutaminylglutamine synthetase [Ancylobacter koreensis]